MHPVIAFGCFLALSFMTRRLLRVLAIIGLGMATIRIVDLYQKGSPT